MKWLFRKSPDGRTISILNKVAAIISLVVGLSAIAIGGQVLLGKVPEHYVVVWMPPLQFILGVVSATFTAFLLWKDNLLAMPMVISTLVLHAMVLVILLAVYNDVVASNTLNMTGFRIAVWLVIFVIMLIHRIQKRRKR